MKAAVNAASGGFSERIEVGESRRMPASLADFEPEGSFANVGDKPRASADYAEAPIDGVGNLVINSLYSG